MFEGLQWIPKGWGGELIIVNNDLYCGKKLFFIKSKKLSWHYHNLKDETFFLQRGALFLTYGYSDSLNSDGTDLDWHFLSPEEPSPGQPYFRQMMLRPGDTFHVPPGLRHRMKALQDSELFEFSTHHEDGDSIRVLKGD